MLEPCNDLASLLGSFKIRTKRVLINAKVVYKKTKNNFGKISSRFHPEKRYRHKLDFNENSIIF